MENNLPKYSPMRGKPAATFSGEKPVHEAAMMNSRIAAAKVSQRLGLT